MSNTSQLPLTKKGALPITDEIRTSLNRLLRKLTQRVTKERPLLAIFREVREKPREGMRPISVVMQKFCKEFSRAKLGQKHVTVTLSYKEAVTVLAVLDSSLDDDAYERMISRDASKSRQNTTLLGMNEEAFAVRDRVLLEYMKILAYAKCVYLKIPVPRPPDSLFMTVDDMRVAFNLGERSSDDPFTYLLDEIDHWYGGNMSPVLSYRETEEWERRVAALTAARGDGYKILSDEEYDKKFAVKDDDLFDDESESSQSDDDYGDW